MQEPQKKPHDIAGLPAGEIDTTPKDHVLWEKRVDAMIMLLQHPSRRLLRTDEVRRSVESLGPDAYTSMSYYERWVSAIAAIMVEKGVVTSEELGTAIEAVLKKGELLP